MRLRGPPAVWALAALVVCSTALRAWGAFEIPSPWFTPDEQTYALMGRSLWESGRFEILGHGVSLLSLAYPAFIGIPLALTDTETAYDALKVLQALAMSLTAVPVYLWGRSLMPARFALAAAALTLAVPGLAFSGFLMTEVLFYPVLVLSAWATARALARPTLTNQALLLASLLVAVATRLQAIVLVPVLALAILLKVLFDRRRLPEAARFAPAFAAIAAAVGVWSFLKLRSGGSVADLLGSYGTAGRTSYSVSGFLRFSLYHAADLVLITAAVPAVALAVLAVRAALGRERSEDARAFLAVAIAYTIGFVLETGLFTSRLLGRLGERYLFALAPLLFLAFALWLAERAPRPRAATATAAAAALGVLATLPFGRLVTEAAIPDAFSLAPLYRLRVHAPDVDLAAVVLPAAAVLLALFVLLPRRRVWLLGPLTFGLLAAAAVSASLVVADQARGFRRLMIGPEPRWVDEAARGEQVAFVYAGEYAWSGGAPAWTHVFWNHDIDGVYVLPGADVVGPLPTRRVAVSDDGRLASDVGGPRELYAVAADAVTLVGEVLDRRGSYTFWRADPPARLSTSVFGVMLATGNVDSEARVSVFDCRGGALQVRLVAPEDRRIEVSREGALYRTATLRAGVPWEASLPVPGRHSGRCTFALRSVGGGFHADAIEFVR